jgi:hypothetical protein
LSFTISSARCTLARISTFENLRTDNGNATLSFDRHMGEKRVVLKDEPYPAPIWRNANNRLASHYDFAGKGLWKLVQAV